MSTPACTHAGYFANANGQFTLESLNEQQKKLGVEGSFAELRSVAILQLAGKMPTPKHVCQIVNKARTGIWNEDGSFNRERFDALTAKSVEADNGKQAVTLDIYNAFLREIHGSGFSGVMVWLTKIPVFSWMIPALFPLTYHEVSEASLEDFFKHFSDTTCQGKNAITVEWLETFYTDPLKAHAWVEKRQRGEAHVSI